jgi:hypothetical protein
MVKGLQVPAGSTQPGRGILRLAYEKYSKAARPSFLSNIIGAVVEPSGPIKPRNKALLNAATTALTAAEVTRLAANPSMRKKWLGRAKEDFDLYLTNAKPRYEKPEPPGRRATVDDRQMYINLQTPYDWFDRSVNSFNEAYTAQELLPDLERTPDV